MTDFVTHDGGTSITQLVGPSVVGIDLSTFAIDLVRLDEEDPAADWLRVNLEGANAWDRVRAIRTHMPRPTWWEDVYLAAIERPFSQSRKDPVRLVQGAVLACIPTSIQVWEVAPQTWKAHVGFKGRGKPGLSDFPFAPSHEAGEWPQDALDALGVALYARDTNAQGIAAQIGAA